LTVSFDSSKFPGSKAKEAEQTGIWTSPPVNFKISGSVRKDPESLLALIGKMTARKWLKTDLTSRRSSRKEEAWLTVYEYGDTRLMPLLETLAGIEAVKTDLRGGKLRQFSDDNEKESFREE